jgi:predicted Zn-dependent peptidase
VKSFYQKWYTPDAMTLIVVGNVDSRAVVEQINKAFGDLKGKRETPAPFRRSLRCVQSLSAL